MPVLNGFPMVDQRTTATTDGLPSENSLDDCVAASICAACMYLNGIKQVGGIYTPDNFKDKADGQGYVGFTAATQYVNFCASLGVKLFSFDGSSSSLVAQAHTILAAGKPVIFTQDDWVVDTSLDKYKGWTHVACWYRDDTPGTLTSMDPWGGFPRMKSDAGWIQVLRDNEIWIAERLEETVRIEITTPGVDYFFEALSDHQWRCKQTGKVIQYAILSEYKGYGNSRLCGLSFLGLPVSDEIPIATGGIVKQHFERGVLCYDPVPHRIDNPPQWDAVYPMHLYSGPGVDPGIAKLQADIVKLQQGQAVNPQLLPDMQQIKGISGKY